MRILFCQIVLLGVITVSATLYAGDGIPLIEFAKQGTLITAPDARGKAVEINGATKFQAKILGTGTPSPYSNANCAYFYARKYRKLKDGTLEHLDTQSSKQMPGVVSIGHSLVQPDIVDFSKKFKPIVKTQGDIQTEEYCLVPNHNYPLVVRVFGSALPPDKNDQVKTVLFYHAEFGEQDW